MGGRSCAHGVTECNLEPLFCLDFVCSEGYTRLLRDRLGTGLALSLILFRIPMLILYRNPSLHSTTDFKLKPTPRLTSILIGILRLGPLRTPSRHGLDAALRGLVSQT